MLKLGSLFDGAGGFLLAGQYAGFIPVWASEIEPFPIRVTSKRFPNIRHLGDIRQIRGGAIPAVDVITFGSPCQDISIAGGKRKGLSGERSGLFNEAVRIIKEMREATDGKYPKFAVWENVCGAFSSNKKRDFQTVLHEMCKITEPQAPLIPVPKNGWSHCGGFTNVGGGSIAYRVFDAQFWGVPQRRKRVYLVADFGNQRSEKILFKRESLLGSSTQGNGKTQKTAGGDIERTGTANRQGMSYCLDRASYNQGKNAQFDISIQEELAQTLVSKGAHAVAYPALDKKYVLRRLMPIECARLQGFPDNWTAGLGIPSPSEAEVDWWYDIFETHRRADGKEKQQKSHNSVRTWLKKPNSDEAEYTMWGNSLCVPIAYNILAGIADELSD
jgi:DNA (cytosine-5)-methyltransferase 1